MNKPTEQPTHELVAKIIDDIEMVDGEALLPSDRVQHWSKVLKTEYWGPSHKNIYLQLGGYALELATKGAMASLQLVALATLPDAAAYEQEKKTQSGFSEQNPLNNKVKDLLGNKKGPDPRATGGMSTLALLRKK